MNSTQIPLIKEYRLERINQCTECIFRNAFNRDKQRECILSLYPTSNIKNQEERDKSIFRGMVIHSLRHLGLIVGYEGAIRVSANGRLLVESKAIDERLQERVMRAIVYEIDLETCRSLGVIEKMDSLSLHDFCEEIGRTMDSLSVRQKNERIRNWFLLLSQSELVDYPSGKILINREKLGETIDDVSSNRKSPDIFEKYFLDAYFKLSKSSAGIVDMIDLRESVSDRFLKEQQAILTEKQFDSILRNILPKDHGYIVSLGKPMGQREKLFEYRGDYFRTVLVRTQRK